MLLIIIYVKDPPEFSGFPTLLLAITLYRLSLNVASTRLILADGHAGNIIDAFGHFVVRGNYVVGAVVFLILVVINFMVITKGAGRIAEVAARFTLDAMPGKQMAIDAELNAGIIDEATGHSAALQDSEGSRLLWGDGRREQVCPRRCDRRHPHHSYQYHWRVRDWHFCKRVLPIVEALQNLPCYRLATVSSSGPGADRQCRRRYPGDTRFG